MKPFPFIESRVLGKGHFPQFSDTDLKRMISFDGITIILAECNLGGDGFGRKLNNLMNI